AICSTYGIDSMSPRAPSAPPFPYTTLFRSGLPRQRRRRGFGAQAVREKIRHAVDDLGRRRPLFPNDVLGREHRGAADEGERHRRSEEHTSELQSRENIVCRLLLEKKKIKVK